MGKYKGRSAVACRGCHAQKLKCDGGDYIAQLERTANPSHRLEEAGSNFVDAAPSTPLRNAHEPSSLPMPAGEATATKTGMLSNCSAEGFIHELKEMAFPLSLDTLHDGNVSYTYMDLPSDSVEPRVVVKLPSLPLALRLFDKFEEIFCDYHWFLRGDFRARLELLYSNPIAQAKDRNWLGRVSLVLALAATFCYGLNDTSGVETSPSLGRGAGEDSEVLVPPGFALFEQGVMLVKRSLEEPTTEDVEALNLMVFYCYSLNRRRTAYTYAVQSIAIARLLKLDIALLKDSTCFDKSFEHRKRLWWTSFCMERMVATELGLPPSPATRSAQIDLPWAGDLPIEERHQFFDGSLLTLHCSLCEIKCQILDAVGRVGQESITEEKLIQELWPCLDTLWAWRESMPQCLHFEFASGIPPDMHKLSSMRGVASLYLRYHQCFILLVRPIYFRDFSRLLKSKGNVCSQQQSLEHPTFQNLQRLKLEGLRAARNNCRIVLDLFKGGKHARYGYWDSVQTFSSLSMLLLSRAILVDSQVAEDVHESTALYEHCRVMLRDMAQAGNLSARDHDTLLTDVEAIIEMLPRGACVLSAEDCSVPREEYSSEMFDWTWSEADWENVFNTCLKWV
ncbi:hypothetical protein B0I35DRAFT_354350 [Stachybotrys elegans]|uniref:Xylanolytic transcriptional activator regulatory domain-containing protein n=1 Tax=Stachybotrys elegans TaxID=80388 RepID=A0A8K0WRV7_9HYPO|nr:hypothetical protein B0I35DRAFT_354350 [Stachybotrys elegans]